MALFFHSIARLVMSECACASLILNVLGTSYTCVLDALKAPIDIHSHGITKIRCNDSSDYVSTVVVMVVLFWRSYHN